MHYEHAFGDGWEHRIVVEHVLPPEDVGGVWGYQDLLEAITDPAHPEHEERLAWIGGEFDPECFDIAAVNRALKPR